MDTMSNKEPLYGRDRVMKASSAIHDLAIFVEETAREPVGNVNNRIDIIQRRCHEIGGDLFNACREILTRPKYAVVETTAMIVELRARAKELEAKASKMPAKAHEGCREVFRDAHFMSHAASRLERLDAQLLEAHLADDDEQLPPWERDPTPQEEYDEFVRILAKKLGCEECNTIILETIGDLQRGTTTDNERKAVENLCSSCTKAPDDCFPEPTGECDHYDERPGIDWANYYKRELVNCQESLRAKEKTIEGLEAEIARIEDERDSAITEARAVAEHSRKLLRERTNLRMLLRCEISKQLCSYERNREDREQPCGCVTCVAARGD
jgi:hypothetical protein